MRGWLWYDPGHGTAKRRAMKGAGRPGGGIYGWHAGRGHRGARRPSWFNLVALHSFRCSFCLLGRLGTAAEEEAWHNGQHRQCEAGVEHDGVRHQAVAGHRGAVGAVRDVVGEAGCVGLGCSGATVPLLACGSWIRQDGWLPEVCLHIQRAEIREIAPVPALLQILHAVDELIRRPNHQTEPHNQQNRLNDVRDLVRFCRAPEV
mmetsp:Transcript_37007/g.104478  ORF Transcript_37007/g.104478 Transcript_37007/m.104478 type:complete len:204 (+) Transcript_37007:219-830(+)